MELVDLVLVDWGNWRNDWATDWRLAQEMRRRGELVRLLVFWLLHSRLKYNSLWNYELTIGMIHERWKVYRLSYTIAKVERGQRSGVTDHRNHAAEVEPSFEKMEQLWEETQVEVDQVMGSQIGPKGKGNKGGLEWHGTWN